MGIGSEASACCHGPLSSLVNKHFTDGLVLLQAIGISNDEKGEVDKDKQENEHTEKQKSFEMDDGTEDRYWMELVDSGPTKEDELSDDGNEAHVDDGVKERVIESSTTVIRAIHRIKSPESEQRSQQPPRSVFAKLAPSRDRYTLLKDEL